MLTSDFLLWGKRTNLQTRKHSFNFKVCKNVFISIASSGAAHSIHARFNLD